VPELTTTLALIKPHAVQAGWTADIVNRYKSAGLKVCGTNPFTFSRAQAESFYVEHKGKPFFPGLIDAMCEGQTVAIILEGEDAVARVRDLNGATNPAKAKSGTIRADFKGEGGPYNTVHGSDSPEAAFREITLVFPQS
tara:strand:- start:743 stop:1159 length:417 start_codon:yes stop_codon:yes gene_type:complete